MKDSIATAGNILNGEALSGINTLQSLTPSELFWYQRLAALQPIQLPFDIPHKIAEPRWAISRWQSPSPKNGQEEPWRILLQTFVIYLARLTQQSTFQIGWCVASNDNRTNMASVVPMDIEVVLDKPWREVADAVDDELVRLTQHQTFSYDLLSDSPLLHAIPELSTRHPWPIAVSVIQDDRQCDQKASGELLTLQINEQGGFRWIYDENRLSAEVIARMDEHLQMLLLSKGRGDGISIGQLNLLPEVERTLLLEIWNPAETCYPEALCIHQLFEQQVQKTPEATALEYRGQCLSYAELNARANRLAHQLIEQGMEPEQRVAICVVRSPAMVVSLLAVLKAGGAYVPLDITYPAERLAYILNDSAPSVILADDTGQSILGDEILAELTVLDPMIQPDQPDSNPQVSALTPQHLAYVIYTSGSTGQPKGVMVEHQAIYQRTLGVNELYGVTAQDRVLQFAAFAFDVSVEECFSSLCHGATLVIRDDSWLESMTEFITLARENRITVMFLPTLFWSELAARDPGLALPDALRLIIIGSEAVQKKALQDWFAQEGHRPRLLNAYGPTENTVTATCQEVFSSDDDRSIGRPLKNTRIYLLDKNGQPVPLGCAGEIYIGGVGVARGYLNQPILSEERFISDPFSPVSGARMYRTGDVARYLPDGNLEFLGRNDQQVKIRGFRVELGEIETRLLEHPAVNQAAVLALDDGQSKRLVAYIVAETVAAEENQEWVKEWVNSLCTHLSALLPDYMVPATFMRLDSFPQTPNGKLDRRALPVPDEEAFIRQAYEAPQGREETILAAVWGELLGIKQISRHDSFFALGGHSLLAMRMIERLRHHRLMLAASDLFRSPVLSDLVKTLGQHRAIEVPPNVITPATQQLTPAMLPLVDLTQADIDHIVEQVSGGVENIQDIYALSPLQDGILFHHLLAREGDPYLLTSQMAFADKSLLDRYLAAMQRIVERHDILRTAFIWQGVSVPVQVVCRHASLSVTELALNPADGPVIDQLNQRFDPRYYRLDLRQPPLLHFVIAQETDGRWHLLQLLHHLIGDHTTLDVMHREVQAYLAGQEENLSAPVPFRNLVAQARLGVSQEAHTRFFTELLAEVEEPTLPFGLTEVHHDGSQVTEFHQMLASELNDRLRSQARRLGVSLAALCHLAWAQVLSRTSGQEKVVFGTVLFGRMAAGEGADSGVGLFINTLPLRLDMDDTPVRNSVQATHRRLAGLLAHEHASLALAQQCSGVDRGTPLFSALLNYRHNAVSAMSEELISGVEFVSEQERTNYPFVLSVDDFGEALGLTVQVAQPVEPERVCGYMQQALESLVNALEHTPDMPVRVLDILPEAERTLLLTTWNTTETPYPESLCIHQLFEQQAEKTPQATALIAGDKTLSYRELNTRANQLARQLIGQGVCPGDHIVLLFERSIVLVVAQLAVLKAGAVYVPLDPSVPDERKNWLFNDCSAKLLLTDTQTDIPADLVVPLFRLSDENKTAGEPTSEQKNSINLDLPRAGTELAYIMYTSGSTGTPKGVLVPHRAVVRLVINNGYAAIEPDDRVAFTANPAFDASTFEVWAPLLNGGALVVIDHAMLLTPVELVRALQNYRITVLWLTIGLFNRLAVELSPVLPQIKTLIFGGDIPDLPVIAQVLKHRPPQQLLQAYGPTEGTTFTTIYPVEALAQGMIRLPIGRPIANTRVYLLDSHGHPVPLGATGEIYVGGDGVACGYLNRPELTAERFLIDPFSDTPDARLYRTGDLARYLPDGNLEFLGRNDQQVKIRGFRIEPGEIEIRLAEHPAVRETAVLVLGDGGNKRLVAYVVADVDEELVNSLRTHLSAVLPDYMVPAAFVRLDEFPLTPNGKLDRRALPAPDSEAFARQIYAAPQGETEMALAAIWSELLGIEPISRHDSFFALGGHSLLAVRMIERLRQQGVALMARDLFRSPVLSDLAQTLGQHQAIEIPPNVITPETQRLIPAMLPLVDLTQADIDHIVRQVPDGMANIQDIYALSPLQDGILFHHLLAHEGDPYLLTEQMAFADRSLLDRYLTAMQRIIERHDILRTAFIWQGVSVPVQVVWRQASLSVTELTLDPADGPVSRQLAERFNVSHYRLNLSDAPLLRFVVAQEADGRWIVLQLLHHLIGDHETVEVMHREVQAYLTGQEKSLAVPVPYRNLVAQARLGVSQEAHTRFFTEMLAEVEEPTLPFGLTEVHRDGSQMTESHRMLAPELNGRLRSQARRFGVSLAALCHLAWAQVLSRTSGQEKVVFGTVLFGRMAEGAGSGMGLFINTLPLRLDMDDTPVQDSVQAAHRRLAGLLTHEHASLALAQQCSGVERGIPLFSALLNYRHNDQSNQLDETLEGIELLDGQERTNYPFVLSVEDFGEALGLTAQVVQPFEPARVCGYMQQALESLVDALEQAPETPVRQLDILPEAECTLLLKTWNATEAAYPEALCIHQLFEQQMEKTPQATALVYENQSLSYAELNARANRLAHQLIALGVEPEQRVAICVSRSPAMVVGLLAVLKTGGAYVPLDPAYPGERLAYNLRDAAPAIVLADNIGRTALGEQALAERQVLDPNTQFDQPDNNPQIPVLTSRHLAYVIYTSGSTGTPKGVMVEHRGLVNLIQDKITQFAIGADSRMLQFASLGFDASVWEIMMSLCSGATLDIPADSVRQNPIYLWHYLETQAITHACLTPALLHDGADVPALTAKPTLILGGEAPSTALLQALCGRVTLFNAYGPTEITVCATTWRCPSDYTDTRVPIGRPTANTQVYLLDAHRQPVPLGAVGELYIGGVGVARGYLNRPELTAEHFLIDPFSDNPNECLYRTGDLARYRPDGNLEFLGRNDQQVKIRGFRIEPGEIEARLAEHPAVRESVVLAQGEGQDKRLVAYLVTETLVTETVVTETKAAETDEGLVNSLRAHLSALLPDYMVPAAFVRLDALPLTPNGKLDRRALPAPDSEAFARQIYAAPQGETEMTLAAIWGELLGIEPISRHDNFFALGGHSLLAVRMIERLRQQGLALTARDLFRSPVLSDLAQMLGRHHAVEVPPNVITPETQQLTPAMLPLVDLTQADIDHIVRQVPGGVANIQDIYALSPLQDGILFHHLLAQDGDPYLLADQMAFADRSLLDRYLAAIQRVVDRHDILRTAFIWQGVSVPVQVVWRHAPLSVTELTLDPADGPVSRQLDERFNINQYRLELSDAPLLRFVVAQEADGRWIVLQLQHHLIGDHETLEVMHREVLAYLTGQEENLPVPVPFRNLVAQVRLGVSQEAHTRFFTEMLEEVEEPTLPFGLAEVYHDGAQETESYRLLAPELNGRLRNQARQQGVSLAALCHLAWAQVLSRTSGQEKVVFGTVLFGRMTGGEGTEGGMGLFINTLPLRLDMDDTPVRDSVQAAHRRLAGLLAHEHASLALAQQCSGVERGTPLFSALLNYRHNSPSDPLDNTLDGFEFLEVQERTNYPFGLSVEDDGVTLGLTANVVQPFDPEQVCGYMQQALESLADALEHTPEMPVRALEILPAAERTLLLNIWNGTEAVYPEALCIHQLFEQQAQKTPEATALEYQGERLSYAELNARANRLAHQLIESGVEPEQRVAICVARSPVMVVALLAVLKAGGAYVPLDITYPAERLAYILSDSTPSVILADNTGQSILDDEVLAELTILDPTMLPDQPDSNPQVLALTPQHLAYVIYTSGSTGQPKGVMVEHQAIYQRTLGVNELYGVTAQDRVLQFAAFAFDVSVEECFSALCHGATLVIRDDSWLASMPEFIALARESRITVMFLPTLFWSELAAREQGLALPDALRLIIIGSEAVQKKALQDWFAQKGYHPRLLNAYGPTENTVTATCQEVFSPDDDRSIGRPLRNTRLYLLDSNGQPVPLGCVGEIYIGGVGVARGYLNQPVLSEARFIPDPFSPVSGARMYRTGDVARYLPDGNLEFLGRNDQQVKIRGFRIEPGEIETRLLEHPSVHEAVVLALDDGQGKRLVAYVVAEADETLVNNLRTHLNAVLPDYMVPAAFVRLDSFPQTPNGKLDRRALPIPDGDAFARQTYEAPQGEIEIALAAIWREVLGIESISRHDNFFALGGHSLLAVRVMNRIAVLGGELPLSELFNSPSLAAFAEKFHSRFDQQSALPPIMPVSREGILPLSFAQQRLWFLTQFEGVSETYHIPIVLRLRGQLDEEILTQALNALFARHEALRSVFVSVDGQPQVHLLAADHGLPLVQHDLREHPDAEAAMEQLCAEEISAPFELSRDPLIRAVLIRLADNEYQFLLTQHHIVSDGWSVNVLIDELNTLYSAFLAGQPDPLSPLAIQYPDYAVWQRQWLSAERIQVQSDYWRTTLADAPVLLDLPTDRPRPSEQSFAGQVLPVNLDAELTAALKRLSEQHGVTLFMTLFSAWAVVLSRLSGQEDVIIGTPSAGRSRQEVESLIGFFVNTLALRTGVSGELTVAELLAQIRQTALGAQAHQDLPFEQVVEIVQLSRRLSHTPLFQVMFSWENNEPTDWTLPELTVSPADQDMEIVKFDLELDLFEENGKIAGDLSYSTALFNQTTMERHIDYLHTVLQAMVANAQQRIGEIDILTPAERRLLLETWNVTETPYPEALCIHQLFEQQAQKTPEATALEYQGQCLSYAELNARANRLAHQLIELGVKPEQRVAICVARSPAMVVSLLAVLKAGGAYVPLDITYPAERLAYILNDSTPSVILADDTGQSILDDEVLAEVIVLDPTMQPDQPDSNPQVLALTPQHLAYVIYTSGSTGQPKGVMVEHQAIYQRTLGVNELYGVTAQDRVLQFAAFAFDVSVEECFSALCHGATLVIRDDSWLASMPEFIALARENRITVMFLPTLFWAELAARKQGLALPDALRLVIIGSEAVQRKAIQDWFAQEGHRPRLLNAYGPTENTVTATCQEVLSPDDDRAIGRPLRNTRIYLLDSNGQPVPLGCVGEIYIGGVGVARGYLNQPSLSEARFILDPFSPISGARMYRTGDVARYLSDGSLEFLGRNDQQVKIRGFRIEPGEIETRLLEHPAVHEAVVLALDDGQGKRLVAYVVAEADEALVNNLRTHLSAVLPDYMVPAAFMRLDSFPQTPNGKLDRRALPAPDGDAFARQTYEAPQGEIEIALAAIWGELLGIEQISRHDNFFALGGHSLLAVRVMNRIAVLGGELPLSTLFNAPSLTALAEAVQARFDQQGSALPPIMPVSREGILPLSFAQQRLWFLAQFEGASETYHIPIALRLRGQLDIAVWQRALNALFARHEALRSVFIAVDGQPQVRLLAADQGLPLVQHDLREHPDAEAVLEQLCAEEMSAPFELSHDPLIRAVLIRLADNEYQFLLTQHHIVSDGWSVNVLIDELNTLYSAFLAGQPDPLPALAIQYPDYAVWQRQWLSAERIQVQSDYWRTTLADAPVLLDLPTDRPRPSEQSFVGQILPINLDAELTAALKRLSAQHGVTLFMTLLSAWAVVLSRLSGQEDVIIGTPSSGRSRQEVESLIGFFVNTLALRMGVSGELAVAELLAQVRQTALAAQAHQDLPFEQVVEIAQPLRQLAHTPLFQVMFSWENNEYTDWTLPGLTVSPADQDMEIVKFDLELGLFEEGDRIAGALNYSTALFDQTTMERHIGYLHTVLQAMVANPQQRIGEIDILTPAERRLLLETWNATETPYPEMLCIHQLFEQQVQRAPNATALVCGAETLSYAELNRRSNRLAHELIAQGVIPEQCVALCVSRSASMMIGLLAILKAGGAYVPLDPAYSGERLSNILSDATPAIVVADAIGRTALGQDALKGLKVLEPDTDWAQPDSNPQVLSLNSGQLAYVIYTSGTTGMPKGVMVEHRGAINLAIDHIARLGVKPNSRVLQFASISFDASVADIVMAYGAGAALHILSDDVRYDRNALWNYLDEHRITHLTLPPAVLQNAHELPPLQTHLTLIFAGEALGSALLQSLAGRYNTFNIYGPTEATVAVMAWNCPPDYQGEEIPIGRPINNTRIYLLDAQGQPVPLGVEGELYIGGVGIARGYLNRPELSAERFLNDPFSAIPGARMYRTGDLARYLPDGNVVYIGRNDQQVKIRGFRIEPGEIEARLMEYPSVRESLVVTYSKGGDKRLVAYVVADKEEELAHHLRLHLSACLPEYMIPSAFVRLDAFPLTRNGKLDRRALPAPDGDAFARQAYETPQGEAEMALAAIWGELLGLEQISRHDSFFALGGHSLLAVRMIERLRQLGLTLRVRDLFRSPVLSDLAQTLGGHQTIEIPPNVITPATKQLTPAMLPLVDLTQADIDLIVGQVPGGVANIQDIYALSPLQDGILFHHLLSREGDTYLMSGQIAFADRLLLDRYLAAMRRVVERHDILRTAFVWQGVSVPVQVVWRHAPLPVTELTLDPTDGPVINQLSRRFDPGHYRLDLNQAPLLHFVVAQETDGRWFLLELQHHMIGDNETAEVMHREVQAYLTGQEASLAAPVPFRNLVAQIRLGVGQEAHTRFFTEMLAEVEEPTLPFGLAEVHLDGSQEMEFYRLLAPELNDRLRNQARRFGVSLAALCHLAWAQVLSRTSGQEKVVFGTVLFGRMTGGEGTDGGMGLFINTLPLRLDIDDTPVRDSVQAAHRRLAGLLAHEHASLALAQQCSGVERGTPLFSALLNYRHNSFSEPSDETLEGIEFLDGEGRTNYPFGLSVEDFGDALGLTASVVLPFDPERVCGYMQQALESLADALEHTPEMPVRALEILPEAERTLLLNIWNGTETAYPEALCIHQLFEQQAQKTPEATALEYQGQHLSYAELNARANRLAHQLIESGVEPEQRVAICVARSPAMVVALLAVLKAGGAYVPLDITYPAERLAYILSDSTPSVVVADRVGQSILGDEVLAELTVLDPTKQPDQPDSNPQVSALTPQHLAYVIYTSGSTGQPKGVMVEHQAIYQRTLGVNELYGVTAQDRVLQFAAFAFDVSVEECFSSLCSGATLVIRDDSWLASMPEFIALARKNRITVMFLPTLFWSELAAREQGLVLPDALRLIIIGSEAVQKKAIQDWFAQEGHRPRLLDAYGPTENTVTATCQEILSPEDDRAIGRPLRNTRVYLLDSNGQPVPLGCVGEIYIGGVGVARGYLNQPTLSEARFIPDPFSPVSDARMYRTGDLARYQPDGNLEFLGRNDHQVKIRGFRIELGEIETRLLEHPAVHEAAVLALDDGQGKRLVAYIVAEADEALVNNLRTHLSAVLPDYMVPAAFVRLDSFPQTPNGKLDRRALPAPDGDAFVRQTYEAPQGEMEIALAAIWREVLGTEPISRHDNFFALGGHSLLAMRVMNGIAALGIELPLSELFSSPSLSALAERLHSRFDQQNTLPPIMPVSREEGLPLSFVQQRLWSLTQFEGVSERYHMPLVLHLRGQLDIAAWQQALNVLFARHEALRSVFVSVDGQPQVQLLAADRGLPLVHHDLRECPDAETALERLRTEEVSAPFDLSHGPLVRTMLIRLADNEYQFLLTQHHIISDGWSVKVLIDELNMLYTAFLAGQPDPLPALAIQYPDYAAWQRQWFSAERMQAQSDYWRTTLADAPALLDLPTDRPRPPEQSFVGQVLPINLDAELMAALKRLSAQHSVTLFMTLLSAWTVVLSRLSGQEDVIIGTPSSGRSRQEVEPLIGFFVNTLALRTRASGELTVAELLAQVRQTTLGAQAHQDLPFEQVVEIVQPSRRLDHTPLFQVMFAWQDYEDPDWTLPGLTVSSVIHDLNIINCDLEIEFFEENGAIVGAINYAPALFDQPTIERHIDCLLTVLQAMVVNPQQRIGEIDILTSAE